MVIMYFQCLLTLVRSSIGPGWHILGDTDSTDICGTCVVPETLGQVVKFAHLAMGNHMRIITTRLSSSRLHHFNLLLLQYKDSLLPSVGAFLVLVFLYIYNFVNQTFHSQSF